MNTIEQDPFATKGIEYLVVLDFLAVLPFFWRYLNVGAALTAMTVALYGLQARLLAIASVAPRAYA